MTEEVQAVEPVGADVPPEVQNSFLGEHEVQADAETEAQETEAAAEENEAESPPAVEEADDKPENIEKETDGIQRRFDELTRLRREAERDRDWMRERLERLEQSQQPQTPPEQQKTLADFNYNEGQYSAYLMEQAAERSRAAAREEFESYQKEQQAVTRRAEFGAREEAFAKDNKDYFDATRSQSLEITPEMASVIQASDKGPEVAYHLAKNPEVASRIARLDGAAVALEIGRIEGRLSYTPPKSPSKAPPPPPKVQAREPGRKISPTSNESDKLSDEEWAKRRYAQIEARKAS